MEKKLSEIYQIVIRWILLCRLSYSSAQSEVGLPGFLRLEPDHVRVFLPVGTQAEGHATCGMDGLVRPLTRVNAGDIPLAGALLEVSSECPGLWNLIVGFSSCNN